MFGSIAHGQEISDADLHSLAGASIALSAAGILLYVLEPNAQTLVASAITAGISSLAAGLGKELIDRLGFGTPERRDIANTVLGAAAAISTMMFSAVAFPPSPGLVVKDLRFTFLAMSVGLAVPVFRYLIADR